MLPHGVCACKQLASAFNKIKKCRLMLEIFLLQTTGNGKKELAIDPTYLLLELVLVEKVGSFQEWMKRKQDQNNFFWSMTTKS